MSETTEITMRPVGGMELRCLDDVQRLATIAVASGLCGVHRPEEAAMILLTGRELGLAPMQSLRSIYAVNGRPVLSADLMVAIVRRSGLCASWRTIETTADVCTIETLREGEREPARKTWTMADARRASIMGKGTWAQYPGQMLRHRCAADLAREVYPDVLMGLYDPDELGGVSAQAPANDPPAESAPMGALDAFREELGAALEALDLAGMTVVYGRHADALGGTSARDVQGVLLDYAKSRGYFLVAAEAQAVLGGTLDADLAAAYDALAAVGVTADDERGDGVIADIVRVVRRYAARPKAVKARIYSVAGQTAQSLGVEDVKARLDAALTPQPPTDGGAGGSAAGASKGGAKGAAVSPGPASGPVGLVEPWSTTLHGIDSYLATKGLWATLEPAVRKYARMVPQGARRMHFLRRAAEALQALSLAATGSVMEMEGPHGCRAHVMAWADEGPKKEAAQRDAASRLTMASSLRRVA